MQQFMEHLSKVDEIESGADEFVMASRVSLLLRGLGLHLQYPMHTAKAWRSQAAALLRAHGEAVPPAAAEDAAMRTRGVWEEVRLLLPSWVTRMLAAPGEQGNSGSGVHGDGCADKASGGGAVAALVAPPPVLA